MKSKLTDSLFIGKDTSPIFIREVAIKTEISEKIVEKVMQFVFKKTHQSFKTNSSVELSGLGTFIISPKRLEKKRLYIISVIEALEEDLKTETREKLIVTKTKRLEDSKILLEMLNQKKNEN